MGAPDNWSNPAVVDAQEGMRMVDFLEARSASSDQVALNERLVEVLAPAPGVRLLEVGCGSGVLCRLLALAVQSLDGHVWGIDIAPRFIAAARQCAARAGLSAWITFEVADAQVLPYADGRFDGAIAARLLLHVPDPERVMSEARRVVRPGGRIVLMDWDFGTVAVDHPDRALTRRILQWRTDYRGGDNWSGRQLWRRALDAGLRDVRLVPVVSVTHVEDSSLTQSLWRAARGAWEAGAIARTEGEAWIEALRARIGQGTFCASIVYFVVYGQS
jgi:ubiquinone/menaquinone biosynthesis C-methylase UbiE